MLCSRYVKFFIVFFILETNLVQISSMDLVTEANFNYTKAYYKVVFVTFLSDDSSTFWTAYDSIFEEIEDRFFGNLYSAIRGVECPKEEALCKRYNIKNDSALKVFISGEEYDTLVSPITSETVLKFIDEYLDDEVVVGSGGGVCNDLEEEEEEKEEEEEEQVDLNDLLEDIEYSFENSTDTFNEAYVSGSTTDSSGETPVTEESVESSTSYEILSGSSRPKFSVEDTKENNSVTEGINSDGENSTENNISLSKADSMKRTADFVAFLSLLYCLYS